jgi:anti-sigma B factor antagonist
VQSETKSRVDQLTSPAGHPVPSSALRAISPAPRRTRFWAPTRRCPRSTVKLILLDFTKVDYINSSGIALVIQLLIEAANSGQKVYAFGLSAHFTKVFTMVGITKYAGLFPTQAEAKK